MITTALRDCEQNIPLRNKELQNLLERVRKETDMNWQVLERDITTGWIRKKTRTLYSVFLYNGGCMPWQQLNFYHHEGRLTLSIEAPVLAAYLMGLLNGIESCDDLIAKVTIHGRA